MGIIPEMRKKVCLGFALFSAQLKQSRREQLLGIAIGDVPVVVRLSASLKRASLALTLSYRGIALAGALRA
jgi:hypothetical protein